ncbi:MAG TPA: sigma-70 family RNA polymerase sigma factor [Candidatus Cloacimonadota bacterium]|mgnify:CR=1 FL=1|nr:sigma-70 family RNA polymerase sigma factor [Candidatus Cloacimonadota bacterium]HOD55459.1 sigma-70 family RNA polymerase sigma factor [Candidatus Cloacimonadota bacterium]HPM02115.1 sigma-70 family RNA polymerase sigma factor [Candidatus Cloacimonadota bacterium]
MNDMIELSDSEMIEKYKKLVTKIAYQYANTGIPVEDLIQEGMIGLLEAKKRFDPDKGASFSTYSVFWIKNRILTLINDELKLGRNVEYSDDMNQDLSNPVEKEYLHSQQKQNLDLPEDMPELEKKVIYLSFVEKKSLTDIALLLNLSREKVRQLKSKGMRRYKKDILNEEND